MGFVQSGSEQGQREMNWVESGAGGKRLHNNACRQAIRSSTPLPSSSLPGALQHGQPVPPVRRVWPRHPEVRATGAGSKLCSGAGGAILSWFHLLLACVQFWHAWLVCQSPHSTPTHLPPPPLPPPQLRQRAGHRRLALALPAEQGSGAGAGGVVATLCLLGAGQDWHPQLCCATQAAAQP